MLKVVFSGASYAWESSTLVLYGVSVQHRPRGHGASGHMHFAPRIALQMSSFL